MHNTNIDKQLLHFLRTVKCFLLLFLSAPCTNDNKKFINIITNKNYQHILRNIPSTVQLFFSSGLISSGFISGQKVENKSESNKILDIFNVYYRILQFGHFLSHDKRSNVDSCACVCIQALKSRKDFKCFDGTFSVMVPYLERYHVNQRQIMALIY